MADFGFFPASTHSASGWNSSTMASIKEQAKELPLYQGASKMSEVWLPVIIIVGLVGNFLTVLVMMQRSNRWNSCSNYIAALAVSDSIALLRKSVDLWVGSSDVRYTEESCKACVYIALTACQYSMLLVLCLTVDRMIAVKYPNRSSVYCSVGRARIVMVGLLVPALLFNIPHIFFTKPIADGKHCATFDGGTDRPTFALIYGVLHLIINSIIPLIALLTMTIIILKTLTKNRKMRERVRSTEETKGDGGRRSTPNFIIYIMTDGLFHFVMAYAANLFKDVEKQMSSSNSTLPTSKDSANSNRVSLVSSEGPRGTPNEAYDTMYEEPDVFDGEGKSKDQGRYNEAYSPTEKSVECRVYDMIKSPRPPTGLGREFREHSQSSEAEEEGISRHLNQVDVDMDTGGLESVTEVDGRSGEYELTDQRRGVCGGTALHGGLSPAHQEDCPPNQGGDADPDLTPSAEPLPLEEEEDYIGTRPMALRRQASRERSRQMTVMLLLVVLFFFILTVPQSVRYILYNGHILDRTSSPEAYASYMIVYHISNKALFTNCAVNFFLYFFGSSLFRESLKETLTCCCRRRERRQEVMEEELPETAVPTVSEGCHAHSGAGPQELSPTASITEATSSSNIVYSTYM